MMLSQSQFMSPRKTVCDLQCVFTDEVYAVAVQQDELLDTRAVPQSAASGEARGNPNDLQLTTVCAEVCSGSG